MAAAFQQVNGEKEGFGSFPRSSVGTQV